MMYYKQAGQRYRQMHKNEKDHLVENLTQSLMFVHEDVQKKVVNHLKQADQEMGMRVGGELFLEL